MSALKQAKFLGKTVLSLFLVFCLSACVPSKIELSPEESHVFCEKYVEETAWIKTAASGPGFISPFITFEKVVSNSTIRNIPLCLFEIVFVESFDSGNNATERYRLHMLIQEVYSGNASIKGKELVGSISLKSAENIVELMGNRYIGYLIQDGELSFFNPYWTFLVTEDNRLVSGYGCQLEDASQISEDGLSVDSRNYTGQTLDYFISKVKEAEANAQTESQENSSQ